MTVVHCAFIVMGVDGAVLVAAPFPCTGGMPAFITSHGRFVAVITPLAPGEVESRVLGEMARKLVDQ